jgi:hypothetical protein
MRTFHHFGIPTDQVKQNASYQEAAGLHLTDMEQSPNRIEWLRFEPDSPMPDMLKRIPHIAYEVEDLAAELEGSQVLMEPFSPREGLTVAFVIEEGAPIELMQFAEGAKQGAQ